MWQGTYESADAAPSSPSLLWLPLLLHAKGLEKRVTQNQNTAVDGHNAPNPLPRHVRHPQRLLPTPILPPNRRRRAPLRRSDPSRRALRLPPRARGPRILPRRAQARHPGQPRPLRSKRAGGPPTWTRRKTARTRQRSHGARGPSSTRTSMSTAASGCSTRGGTPSPCATAGLLACTRRHSRRGSTTTLLGTRAMGPATALTTTTTTTAAVTTGSPTASTS